MSDDDKLQSKTKKKKTIVINNYNNKTYAPQTNCICIL